MFDIASLAAEWVGASLLSHRGLGVGAFLRSSKTFSHDAAAQPVSTRAPTAVSNAAADPGDMESGHTLSGRPTRFGRFMIGSGALLGFAASMRRGTELEDAHWARWCQPFPGIGRLWALVPQSK